MPTITKPKTPKWDDNSWPMVKVTDEDIEILGFLAGIKPKKTPKKGDKFAEDIEELINCRVHKLVVAMHKPLPAHVVAVLEPMHAHAVALASLLDPYCISGEVQKALVIHEIDDGKAWDLLMRIGMASQLAIASLKKQSRSGLHKQHCSQEVQYAIELFIDFFEKIRGPSPQPDGAAPVLADQRAYDADRKEFLEICLAYLPDMTAIAKGNATTKNE